MAGKSGSLKRTSTTKAAAAPHLTEPVLKTVTAKTFVSYCQAVGRGFQEEWHDGIADRERPVTKYNRFFGFRVGDRWVSTFGSFERTLTVPGGAALPASAVTCVTVQPPYRRRGLLTQMMRHDFEACERRGEPVAVLWASESMIYGRFGFAPALSRLRLSGNTRRLQFLPQVRPEGSVDEVTKQQFLAVAPALRDAQIPDRPGSLDRPLPWWEYALFDPEYWRGGYSELRFLVHYNASGDADGYASYRFKHDWNDAGPSGEVLVTMVHAASPGAEAGLWRYLLDLDLARNFQWRHAPVDDTLRHLVTDARAIKSELQDAIYLRLIDVARCLRERRYLQDGELVVAVDDPQLPANTGRYRLRITDGEATVARTKADPDLSLGVLELGASYLGGVGVATLHRAGRIREHTAGAVDFADRAFCWPRAPWCEDNF